MSGFLGSMTNRLDSGPPEDEDALWEWAAEKYEASDEFESDAMDYFQCTEAYWACVEGFLDRLLED